MGEITAHLMEQRGDGEGAGGGSSAPLLLYGDLRERCHLPTCVRSEWGWEQSWGTCVDGDVGVWLQRGWWTQHTPFPHLPSGFDGENASSLSNDLCLLQFLCLGGFFSAFFFPLPSQGFWMKRIS